MEALLTSVSDKNLVLSLRLSPSDRHGGLLTGKEEKKKKKKRLSRISVGPVRESIHVCGYGPACGREGWGT